MNKGEQLYINIGKLTIPYSLTENQKTKNVKLIIDISGLKVIKPSFAKLEDIEKILKSKSNWIYKHLINFQFKKVEKYQRNGKTEKQFFIRVRHIILRFFQR